MIEVNNLNKRFEDFDALKDANMHVEKGCVYGLVGPNGAGKTTMLKTITGIYMPDAGTVRIDGSDVYDNPAIKDRFVFIPDDLFFFVQANINDMRDFYAGMYSKFDKDRFERLASVFHGIDRKQVIRKITIMHK